MPAAVWLRLKVLRDFRRHRARHHPRRELDDVDFEALGPRGRGEFQADESGADHDDALARSDVVAATTGSRRASADSARCRGWRWECRAGDCARRSPAPDGRNRAKRRRRATPCARRDRSTPRDRRSDRCSGRSRIFPAGTSGCRVRRSPSDRPWTAAAAGTADGLHRSTARCVRKSRAGAATSQAESPHGPHR